MQNQKLNQISKKIKDQLMPSHFQIENESHMHSVPENSETHFKLIIVSQHFNELSRVERQQLVYKILDQELKNGVHALSQRCFTVLEWESVKDKFTMSSPECLGGGKF